MHICPYRFLQLALLVAGLAACGDNGGNGGSTPNNFTLTVTLSGSGSGVVTSDPQGISCGDACNADFPERRAVTLTPTPGAGSNFAGWQGCNVTPTNKCTVTMKGNEAITATFNEVPEVQHTLAVSTSGQGTVTSEPTGIDCGNTCQVDFTQNSSIVLTAIPAGDWRFDTWSGCNPASGNTCTVKLSASKTVTAAFAQATTTRQLTVLKIGQGTVSSKPVGIDCGSTCQADFAQDSLVVLTATPAGNRKFDAWSGCDSASGNTCTVTLSASKTVTATFTQATQELSVESSEQGSVTSEPDGIDCGDICQATFVRGAEVSLTAIPAEGWAFASWSGDLAGSSNPTSVIMDRDKSVTATFLQTEMRITPTDSACNGVAVDTECDVRVSLHGKAASYRGLEFRFSSTSFSLISATIGSQATLSKCVAGTGPNKVIMACEDTFSGPGEVVVLKVKRTAPDASSFIVSNTFVASDANLKIPVQGGSLAVTASD